MKRLLMAITLVGVLTMSAAAGPQFRAAANVLTPIDTLPLAAPGWYQAALPTERTMSGWHWEVILDRMGFGMHYAMNVYETPDDFYPYALDWKGDLFLSYHPSGGGSVFDPFVEIGWGNAGTTGIPSVTCAEYPDWKQTARKDEALALALYSYGAVGVALDLNGLLLGARFAYHPQHLVRPVPDPSIERYALPEFEFGLFAGVALGSHGPRRRPDPRPYYR